MTAVESRGISGASDDLNGPVAKVGEGVAQVWAIVNAVGEEVAQPRKQLKDGLDDDLGPTLIRRCAAVSLAISVSKSCRSSSKEDGPPPLKLGGVGLTDLLRAGWACPSVKGTPSGGYGAM